MDKDAIVEYYEIMNTVEILIKAMKWIQQKQNNYDLDVIIAISEIQLNNLRRFCINHVGDLEE
ncbi:hypothetical protein IJ384_03045 [bacterium]|nr:hypothetical protein [bacterium]